MVRNKSSQIETCFRSETEIACQILKESKFDPTSYIYDLMSEQFQFNKIFSKIVIAKLLNENFQCKTILHSHKIESDIRTIKFNENESDTSSSSSGPVSGNNDLPRENRITSEESISETDILLRNIKEDSYYEIVSSLSSETETASQPVSGSLNNSNIHLDESYDMSVSESLSSNEMSFLNESYRDCDFQLGNISGGNISFQFEECNREIDTPTESESSEEKRAAFYYQGEDCNVKNRFMENSFDEITQIQNKPVKDDTLYEKNSFGENIRPKNNSSGENDARPKSSFSSEDDERPRSNSSSEDERPTSNSSSEDRR